MIDPILTEADEGAAFVFRGSPSGIADSSPATAGVARERRRAARCARAPEGARQSKLTNPEIRDLDLRAVVG
ncbi:MAG: hypothetical protein ACREQ9_14680, partial [Candidatus Binatia bacterium]